MVGRKLSMQELCEMKHITQDVLEEFVPDLPTMHLRVLRKFRTDTFKLMHEQILQRIRKGTKGYAHEVDYTYFVLSVCLACIEVAMAFCLALQYTNPAASELVKRALKDKISKW